MSLSLLSSGRLFGILMIVAAGALGGWEWALLSSLVLIALPAKSANNLQVLATSGVGLFWLAIFHWTDDRRMFFPFSIQYAVQLAYLMRARVSWPALKGGAFVVGVFLLIRITQSAGWQVLAVELIVAVAVLWFASIIYGPGECGPVDRAADAALGSALAFAGLIF